MGQENFCVEKKMEKQNFWFKKIFGQKVWVRKFVCLTVGLNCVRLLLVLLGDVAYKISDH